MMIRKLLLPAVAIALLGGCVTDGYSYRQDRGDYYYGEPGVDYRHHGTPYGYYNGYYGNSYYGNSYYYRNRGYPYYGYGNGYYRPPVVIVRPRPDGNDHPGGNHDDRDNDQKAPWRDFERLKRERIERSPVVQRQPMSTPVRPATRPAAPAPRVRSTPRGGSRMEQVIRRAKRGAIENPVEN